MASRSPGSRSPRGRDTDRTRRPSGGRGTRPSAKKKSPGSGPQVTTRAIVLLSVILLLFASYTASFRAWWGARQEIQATKAERATLNAEIKQLEENKERFDDPAYIKQQARERFGWVMPGEVGYRVIGADGSVRGQVPVLDEPPEVRQPQWYDKLWGTVETAGSDKGNAAPKQDEPTKPLEGEQ